MQGIILSRDRSPRDRLLAAVAGGGVGSCLEGVTTAELVVRGVERVGLLAVAQFAARRGVRWRDDEMGLRVALVHAVHEDQAGDFLAGYRDLVVPALVVLIHEDVAAAGAEPGSGHGSALNRVLDQRSVSGDHRDAEQGVFFARLDVTGGGA